MYFQRTSLSKNIFLWYDKKESYFCEEKTVFISGLGNCETSPQF